MAPSIHTLRTVPMFHVKPFRIFLASLSVVACAVADPSPSPRPDSRFLDFPRTLISEADQGRPGPRLLSALQSSNPVLLAHALRISGAFPERLPADLWLRVLSHPVPSVRTAAAHAVALLPHLSSPLVLGHLAAETDPSTRAALTRTLARLPASDVHGPLRGLLEASPADEASAACLALAFLPSPPTPPYALIAQRLHSPHPPLRLACAFALSRLPVPSEGQTATSVGHDLSAALRDPSPEVRLLAATSLARHVAPDLRPLEAAILDADWRVSAQAFHALSRHARTDDYLASLTRLADAVLADPRHLDGAGLRVWEAAFRYAPPPSSSSRRAASRWLSSLGPNWPHAPSAEQAAARCAVASWLHSAAPAGPLLACDSPRIPAALGISQRAHHLASVLQVTPAEIAQLRADLQANPDSAAGIFSLLPRSSQISLLDVVLPALRGQNAAHAARGLARLGPTLQEHGTPQQRDAARSALLQAMQHSNGRASVAAHLALLRAANALDPLSFAPSAAQLASHPSPDVARAAAQLLDAQPESIPARDTPAQPALPPEALVTRPRLLRLPTSRGDALLRLDPSAAPTSVTRLLRSVAKGWLEGAMLVPSLEPPELAIGDPYAAPPGAPAWIPREPHTKPFIRGSVGLVRTGHASSSLALFVTFSRRHDLDGGPTHIGEVVSGLGYLEGALLGAKVGRPEVLPDARQE